uniref:Protein RD3-like n=1 Tax=Myripristis murdjan TaxID=586833 RepID=A0A668AAG1_9TELE
MPLFGWMKWSQEAGVQAQDEAAPLNTPGAVPSRMLIRELLWHVEERERLARELEREHRLAHSALGFHWFQKYPRLRTLIPTSELHQLECLCAQIPPVHTATVLSRFREVLATNNILPWELVYVFKQVLRDFLNKEDCEEEEELSSFVTPTVPNCGEQQREEIPTISGYVDRAMRRSSSFTAHRDCDLPDYYEVSLRPSGAYSTTL